MSLFNRRYVLLGLPALATCGFTPVYGPGGSAEKLRGAVLVDAPTTRDSFDLVAALEERLGRPKTPKYGLNVVLSITEEGLAVSGSNDITRYNVIGGARYTLRALATNTPVCDGTVRTFTGYSASDQAVSTVVAARNAKERLMTALADKIVTNLLLNSGVF